MADLEAEEKELWVRRIISLLCLVSNEYLGIVGFTATLTHKFLGSISITGPSQSRSSVCRECSSLWASRRIFGGHREGEIDMVKLCVWFMLTEFYGVPRSPTPNHPSRP